MRLAHHSGASGPAHRTTHRTSYVRRQAALA